MPVGQVPMFTGGAPQIGGMAAPANAPMQVNQPPRVDPTAAFSQILQQYLAQQQQQKQAAQLAKILKDLPAQKPQQQPLSPVPPIPQMPGQNQGDVSTP